MDRHCSIEIEQVKTHTIDTNSTHHTKQQRMSKAVHDGALVHLKRVDTDVWIGRQSNNSSEWCTLEFIDQGAQTFVGRRVLHLHRRIVQLFDKFGLVRQCVDLLQSTRFQINLQQQQGTFVTRRTSSSKLFVVSRRRCESQSFTRENSTDEIVQSQIANLRWSS